MHSQRNNLSADNSDYQFKFDIAILIRPVSKLIFFTGKTMGRKCRVTNCKLKEKVFRLPVDENERKRWLIVIPRDNTHNTKDTAVCE